MMVTMEMITQRAAINGRALRAARTVMPDLRGFETDYEEEPTEVLRFEVDVSCELTLAELSGLAEVFGTQEISVKVTVPESWDVHDLKREDTRVEVVILNATIPSE